MEKVIDFIKDVKIELSKVSWPTREQIIQYTLVVLGLSLFVAVFLGAWDWIFQFVLNRFVLR